MHILVFLLLFGYGWASFLPNGCPADDDVQRLLPHETDCGKFYACSNGRRILMQCPSGLCFDVELQICDWPRDTESSTPETTSGAITTKVTTPGTNTTTIAPTTTVTPTTTVNYTTVTTPSLNTTTQMTTTTTITTSYSTTTPVMTTQPTITTPRPIPPNECPTEWQVMLKLPEDSDCEKYFHCSKDIKLLLKCPKKKLKSFEMLFSANYTKTFGKADV